MRMLVAAHKAAEVPADDFYLPVHVGHALNPVDLGYQPDDDGQNISELNGSYCELTALYWALNNLAADGIGLSHYRRYFRGTQAGPGRRGILSLAEAEQLIERHRFVLARPRNYLVETIESHYRHSHYGSDLGVLRRKLEEYSPWMLHSWDALLRRRRISLYNMFIMRWDDFAEYGDWLFTVLGAAEKEIDNSERTPYEQRTFGYLGELMLDAWVSYKCAGESVAHKQIVNTEGEPKIAKGMRMVERKYFKHDLDLLR